MTIRTTAIRAIIRPYSTIVAPSSSRMKRFNMTQNLSPARTRPTALTSGQSPRLVQLHQNQRRRGQRSARGRKSVGSGSGGDVGGRPGKRALEALAEGRDDHDQDDRDQGDHQAVLDHRRAFLFANETLQHDANLSGGDYPHNVNDLGTIPTISANSSEAANTRPAICSAGRLRPRGSPGCAAPVQIRGDSLPVVRLPTPRSTVIAFADVP